MHSGDRRRLLVAGDNNVKCRKQAIALKFPNRGGNLSAIEIFQQLSLRARNLGQIVGKVMPPDEVVDLIDALEGEVNNGGFHQYFYNSAGDRTAETIQALEIVGAFKIAEIVKKAAQMFPGGMPPKDRFERQEILLKLYPKAIAFRGLDEEFYDYPDKVAELLKKYRSSSPPR